MDKQGRLFGISVLGACALLAAVARPPAVPFASPSEVRIRAPGVGLAAHQPSQSQSQATTHTTQQPLGDLFALQDEVCRQIVESLPIDTPAFQRTEAAPDSA